MNEKMEVDHRQLGVDIFNYVWTLLDKDERTPAEDDSMLNAAHASRYHWEQVGTAVNLVRGDWQIARVYTVLNRAEPALYHAGRCLDICQENDIGDFDLAFAYEALARAWSLTDNVGNRQRNLSLALKACEAIADDEDRQYVLNDLKTIPGYEQLARES